MPEKERAAKTLARRAGRFPFCGRVENVLEHNARRHLLLKCDATAKSTGQRCRREVSPGSTKCRLHGGRTPKGDRWHRPVYPKNPEKFERKVKTLEKRAGERAARVKRMSPDELAAHKKQRRSARPGTIAEREARRDNCKRVKEAQSFVAGILARRQTAATAADNPKASTATLGAVETEKAVSGQICKSSEHPKSGASDMTKKAAKTNGMDELIREMRTNGAPAAYRALLEVCQKSDAPAQARATSAAAILRAAGFLEKKEDMGVDDPIGDMTAEEIDAALAREEARLAALKRVMKEDAAIKQEAAKTKPKVGPKGGIFD